MMTLDCICPQSLSSPPLSYLSFQLQVLFYKITY